MSISLWSLIATTGWSCALIALIHGLRKHQPNGLTFSVRLIPMLYLFCILRAVLPLDFTGSIVISDSWLYPRILEILQKPLPFPSFVGVSLSLLSLGAIVWGTGTAFLLIRYFYAYWKARLELRQSGIPCDAREFRILQMIRTNMQQTHPHIKQPKLLFSLAVYRVLGLDNACEFGIFQRHILLPEASSTYTDQELYHLLLHEYTHICNNDVLANGLSSLFCILFWWNPFAYLLKVDLEQAMELKCDAMVTQDMTYMEKAAYLRTMIRIVASPAGQKKLISPSSAFLRHNMTQNIKERCAAIAEPKQPQQKDGTLWILGIFFALIILSYAVIVQPAFFPELEEGPGIIYCDESNTYILQNDKGEYWIYTQGLEPERLSQEEMVIFSQSEVPIYYSKEEKPPTAP